MHHILWDKLTVFTSWPCNFQFPFLLKKKKILNCLRTLEDYYARQGKKCIILKNICKKTVFSNITFFTFDQKKCFSPSWMCILYDIMLQSATVRMKKSLCSFAERRTDIIDANMDDTCISLLICSFFAHDAKQKSHISK